MTTVPVPGGRSAATRGKSGSGGVGHWQQRADVVVIGTGVAGLVAALAAVRAGRKVLVLSKIAETATFYAQGGIAVVLPGALREDGDSVEAHVADLECDPVSYYAIGQRLHGAADDVHPRV